MEIRIDDPVGAVYDLVSDRVVVLGVEGGRLVRAGSIHVADMSVDHPDTTFVIGDSLSVPTDLAGRKSLTYP
jgi:hypothetical protein